MMKKGEKLIKKSRPFSCVAIWRVSGKGSGVRGKRKGSLTRKEKDKQE